MARIRPTPFPSHLANEPGRRAERIVYDAFENGLSNKYHIYYGVPWLRPRGEGEDDFLLVHPKRGILLCEVKGGEIARDGTTGQWFSHQRAKGLKFEIKDPFDQLRKNVHALVEKLERMPVFRLSRPRIERVVIFPDTFVPPADLGLEMPRALIIDHNDLKQVSDAIDRVFAYYGMKDVSGTLLDSKQLATMDNEIAYTVELKQPLSFEIEDEEREIVRLTEEQFHVLDALRYNHRVKISGGAGTGKTFLAVEKARRLATAGFKTLLTCFNRPLMDHLVRSTQGVENLTTLNFDSLCRRTSMEGSRMAGGPMPPSHAPPDFFRDYLAERLELIQGQEFGAIVVDEGQDFVNAIWWDLLELMLEDRQSSPFYVFYDNNQQIRGGAGEVVPMDMVRFELTANLRNARPIWHLASNYYHAETSLVARGPLGRDVTYLCAENWEDRKRHLVEELLKLTEEEKIAPRDIAILCGQSLDQHWLKDQRLLGGVRVSTDDEFDSNSVFMCSVSRFKGLERSVIILLDMESTTAETMYVALTRAKHHLLVIVSADLGKDWIQKESMKRFNEQSAAFASSSSIPIR